MYLPHPLRAKVPPKSEGGGQRGQNEGRGLTLLVLGYVFLGPLGYLIFGYLFH